MKRLPSTPQYVLQQEIEERKRKIIKRRLICLAIEVSFALIVIVVFAFFNSDFWGDIKKAKYENELRTNGIDCELIFSDEENGNAVLLECDGSFALIDSGNELHKEETLSFLKENNVEKLEYYFVSDLTEEYMSVYKSIIESVEIKEIILPADKTENGITADFDEIAFANGKTVSVLNKGKSFYVNTLIIKTIEPYSSSFELSFKNNVFIFWNSDDDVAQSEAVEYFNEETSYVLYLGKNADEGSTLLETLTPRYCIVDSENGKYNMEFIEKYADKVYVTNNGKNIVVSGNEIDIEIKEENH